MNQKRFRIQNKAGMIELYGWENPVCSKIPLQSNSKVEKILQLIITPQG